MSSYKALYRKWRPSVFSDVIGQEHITSVLKSEIMSQSVSHAYLFCGSRGTGKTTCAKILSKAVSCDNPVDGDPCGKCPSCLAAENTLDIYEIDAASYTGVDNIRELRDTVVYPPSEMKRRVYIIDEVHMLTDSAFNALLKTLEEPPAHAMFILATTELRKIPATILSRCKRFDFHRITPEKICERLRMISDEENIKITDGALMLISRLATGAMRDALSMLELFYKADHEITEEEATERLGVVGRSVVFALLDAVCEKDTASALSVISEAYNNSKDLGVLCSELSDTLRDIIVTKYVKDPSKLIDATQSDIEKLKSFSSKLSDEKLMYCCELCEDMQSRLSRAVFSRRTIIETGIIKMCEEKLSFDTATLLTRISDLEEKMAMMSAGISPARTPVSQKIPEKKADEPIPSDIPFDEAPPMPSDSDIPFDMPSDMPFDGPYTEKSEVNKAPKPISPRPLSPRPLVKPQVPADTSSPSRKPLMSYAELIEDVASCDKIAASMLEGGRGYICDGNVCEFEVTNPIAPMLLKQGDKAACLEAALTKLLGYTPNIKIKFVAGVIVQNKADLSSLE